MRRAQVGDERRRSRKLLASFGEPKLASFWSLTLPVAPQRRVHAGAVEDGLNLSRAWMLEGIAATVTGEHYEGGHWLGTFAVYLVTGRGLR